LAEFNSAEDVISDIEDQPTAAQEFALFTDLVEQSCPDNGPLTFTQCDQQTLTDAFYLDIWLHLGAIEHTGYHYL
jgi:hypothetical protein